MASASTPEAEREATPATKSGEGLPFDQLVTLEENIASVLRGKSHVVRLAMTCLLAEGHLLLEDVPGVGKTTLARAIARSIELPFRRIQFTADMLPSDILGVSIFDEAEKGFTFHPGPLFHNVVLADEINRASPRTQSAMLEAMHERVVSIDSETHALPRPFMVIATQNPFEFHGTYPLPESQLDRFLLRLSLGYPERDVERELLLERRGREEPVSALSPVLDAAMLKRFQDAVDEVHVEPALADYLMEVVGLTRKSPKLELGLSTRAALTTLRAARAHALLDQRDHCLPDDFAEVLVPATAHRVRLTAARVGGASLRQEAEKIMRDIVAEVPVPR